MKKLIIILFALLLTGCGHYYYDFYGETQESPLISVETETYSEEYVAESQTFIAHTTEEISETSSESIPKDITPPEIIGEAVIYTAIGSSIRYKSYEYVMDDSGEDIKLDIDNSMVNLNFPGDYIVVYTATDSSGNTTTKNVTVHVAEAEEPHVDEDIIYQAADSVIEKIISDDMDDLQKIFAVFYYARENITYTPDNHYWEYKQEAYEVLQDYWDNCYANVSLVRLLLERLGYKVYMREGYLGYLDERHYWCMVSMDNGENWYYLDPASWTWMHDDIPLCMLTEETAMIMSDRHGGLFNCDTGDTMTASSETLWTYETMEEQGLEMWQFGY